MDVIPETNVMCTIFDIYETTRKNENGHSRETGNTGYKTQKDNKQNKNTTQKKKSNTDPTTKPE
jgi:hypothetical protein